MVRVSLLFVDDAIAATAVVATLVLRGPCREYGILGLNCTH